MRISLVIIPIFLLISFSAFAYEEPMSEDDYNSEIGSCGCPYNTDANGNSCGVRSAWCKSSGVTPTCDASSIQPGMNEACLSDSVVHEPANISISDCMCPYDLDSVGNYCGKRSAWCKPGGAPACDLTRVTHEMIDDCKYGSD